MPLFKPPNSLAGRRHAFHSPKPHFTSGRLRKSKSASKNGARSRRNPQSNPNKMLLPDRTGPLSLTPRFSEVERIRGESQPFQRFSSFGGAQPESGKPLKW